MKKIILSLAGSFMLLAAWAQKRVSTHIEFIQQTTIADRTIKNNPWGAGLGLQTLLNPGKKFSSMIDLSGFLYLSKVKLLYTGPADEPMPDVENMVNLFGGIVYKPNSIVYLSLAAGPSYIDEQTLFGLKPAFGFYFSPSQKWKAQVAYLNVFNRGAKGLKGDFTSVALSAGLRLF